MILPVEIVAAHDGDTLLVRHFPYFKKWQIAWWEKNKSYIKETYGIPVINKNGNYSVYILGFGDGYRIDSGYDQDSNLLCFEDMEERANCIDKDPLLNVGSAPNTEIYYR